MQLTAGGSAHSPGLGLYVLMIPHSPSSNVSALHWHSAPGDMNVGMSAARVWSLVQAFSGHLYGMSACPQLFNNLCCNQLLSPFLNLNLVLGETLHPYVEQEVSITCHNLR